MLGAVDGRPFPFLGPSSPPCEYAVVVDPSRRPNVAGCPQACVRPSPVGAGEPAPARGSDGSWAGAGRTGEAPTAPPEFETASGSLAREEERGRQCRGSPGLVGLRHLGKGHRVQPAVPDERQARQREASQEQRREGETPSASFLPRSGPRPASAQGSAAHGFHHSPTGPETSRQGRLGGSVGTAPRGSGGAGRAQTDPVPRQRQQRMADCGDAEPPPGPEPSAMRAATVPEGLGLLLLFLFVNVL